MFDYNELYDKTTLQRLADEYKRLNGAVYLDHAGAALYSSSQLQAVTTELLQGVFGNPHSRNTSSRLAADAVDQVRYRVLQHFNTNTDEYSVIFTSGATSALKLVAESFDWSQEGISNEEQIFQNGSDGGESVFMYLQESHTSVLGMRELAKQKNVQVKSVSQHELFESMNHFRENELNGLSNGEPTSSKALFVYPAQCNFSGLKYPLSWVNYVQQGALNRVESGCSRKRNWFCFLDAASYVSTNSLDLSTVKPDFVCLSYYKMFGYPTGLGALLVRNSSAHVLKKDYFGGGTVLISLSGEDFHVKRPLLHERMEDGTIPFLSIIALRHGFDLLNSLPGGMNTLAQRTFLLARYLHHRLHSLHHSDTGKPLARIYCDTDFEDARTQGGIVSFNLLRPEGEVVGFTEVEHMANLHDIHLRTGCFCNPGACQRYLGLSANDLRHHFQAGHVCGDERDLVDGQPTGAVRVSFGITSTQRDVDYLLEVIESCFTLSKPKTVKNRPFAHLNRYQKFLLSHFNQSLDKTEKAVPITKDFINDEVTSFPRLPQTMPPVDHHVLTSDGDIVLSHLFLYPIKSAGFFRVSRWPLGPRGLLYDRNWMVVDSSGVSFTQKREPRLCLLSPQIDLEAKTLTLNYLDVNPITIPVATRSKNIVDSKSSVALCNSKVCGDRISGRDCGEDVADWLSRAFGREGLRLVCQDDDDSRHGKVKGKTTDALISLSNQSQFLLLNEASIKWLMGKVEERSGLTYDAGWMDLMLRFRGNFVVSGTNPLEEKTWTSVSFGAVQMKCEGPCTRCQMVCIDQNTGDKTKEPLLTISATFAGKMEFGVYLSQAQTNDGDCRSVIGVGDKVTVVQ